jgi:parvulin-like peptidyl-prolyl isomerase
VGVWSFLPEVVAEIDGKKITRDEFMGFLRKRVSPVTLRGFDERDFKSYARELLEQYINQMILSELAAADGYPPSKMVLRETKRWLEGASKEERESFERYLKKEGLTLEEYCEKNSASSDPDDLRQMAIDAWRKEKIEPAIKVSDEDVKKYYDNAADVVKVSQILVKPAGNTKEAMDAARKRAEELRERLRNGEDFKKLASEESDCTRPNGDLGAFGRGEMVREFDDVAFNMKKGDVSDVFQTMFGFHIIRIEDAWKRKTPPLDDALKRRIRERLKTTRVQDFMIDKLMEARKKRVIKEFF